MKSDFDAAVGLLEIESFENRMIVGFFPATTMPDADWWQALWPDPVTLLVEMGVRPAWSWLICVAEMGCSRRRSPASWMASTPSTSTLLCWIARGRLLLQLVRPIA